MEGQLLDALKGSEAVRAVSPAVEQAVSAGQITAVEGAHRIVHALAQDLPDLVGDRDPS